MSDSSTPSPIPLTSNRKVRVGTHGGEFHADDVLAVAALGRLCQIDLVRTRDIVLLAECELVVDVGGEYVPERGRFDHHQAGRAGFRENGIFYSAFGLIWRHYGVQICQGDEKVAAEVDRTLVQSVDAVDNGVSLWPSDPVVPYTVSHYLGDMNPAWGETTDGHDAAFGRAVAAAQDILEGAIRQARGVVTARRMVEQAIAQAEDPSVLVFAQFNFDWAWMAGEASEVARLVLYPSEDGSYWFIQTTAPKRGSFEMRCPLPAEWAGKRDQALASASGIEGTIFVHPGRFIGGAKTLEGVKRMAQIALQ